MTCPFARFASMASSLSPSTYSNYHHGSTSKAASTLSSATGHPLLSEHLKTATAKAHKEVETSAGVRKLMGFGGVTEDGHLAFGRLDYVRWMIILACIYAALESSLLEEDAATASMLSPLLQAQTSQGSRLLDSLLRFPAAVQDIHAHLATLRLDTGSEEGAGLEWDELVEEVTSERDASAEYIYQDLERLVTVARQETILKATSSSDDQSLLTPSHLRLLLPAEAEATLLYVNRILSLANRSGSSDLLLSQAYVRYLGDLSGGQHIKRMVAKHYPMTEESLKGQGFAFYDFPAPSSIKDSVWHHELKDIFRTAMNAGLSATVGPSESNLSQVAEVSRILDAQGREASLAFELNKDLFESLIGVAPSRTLPALDPIASSSRTRPSLSTFSSNAFSDLSTSSSLSSSSSSSENGDEPLPPAAAQFLAQNPALRMMLASASASASEKRHGLTGLQTVGGVSFLPLAGAGLLLAVGVVLARQLVM